MGLKQILTQTHLNWKVRAFKKAVQNFGNENVKRTCTSPFCIKVLLSFFKSAYLRTPILSFCKLLSLCPNR